MRKKLFILALLTTIVLSGFAKKYTITSPDGHVRMTIQTGTTLTYSVERDQTLLLKPSEIGLTCADGRIWGAGSRFMKAEKRHVDISCEAPIFKRSTVRDYYNELTLRARDFSLCFRVYDDGVAWRFCPAHAETIRSEQATFAFAQDWQAYVPYVNQNTKSLESQFYNSFEAQYDHPRLSQWNKERLAFLPVTIEAAEGIRLCVVESDLLDYPGMYLYNEGDGQTLKGVFAPVPDETYQGGYNQLQRVVRTRKNVIAENTSELPWRGIIIATEDRQVGWEDN